jgi:hypothetical protein
MSSIGRPSKIYPNWDFRFEDTSSGNPGLRLYFHQNRQKEEKIRFEKETP